MALLLALVLLLNAIASHDFNGCQNSSWDYSYYPSKIFSDECMVIPSNTGSTNAQSDIHNGHDHQILPSLWYNIGSGASIYYNISYNISCNLVDNIDENWFYVMFRVQSIENTETYEFDHDFKGENNKYYVLIHNCGINSQIIRVRKYPYLNKLDENKNYSQHHFDLNNGNMYNVKIIVGDEINHNPKHYKILINNKVVLEYDDSAYKYGGFGLSALNIYEHKSSTFNIHNFDVDGIEIIADTTTTTTTTEIPSTETCDDLNEIGHINWINLAKNKSLTNNILHNFEMNIDKSSLTLNIKMELKYLGYSYADRLETYGYGTTYMLDFSSFNSHKSAISSPGTCSNRCDQTFADEESITFNELWNYSTTPYVPGHIGQNNRYLAYPTPTDYWNMYMKHDECTPLVYQGKFNLNDLRSCTDYKGKFQYLKFINTKHWMNISGTFYINLVSPMNKDHDVGYYYVYELLSSPFMISIKKTVGIISHTGISLFTLTFVAVYTENTDADDGNQYHLVLLTESADYLHLTINQLIDSPSPSLLQLNNTNSNNECLILQNNICSQLFEIYSVPVDCINDIFTGQYGIRFNIECNPNINNDRDREICNNWLNSTIEDIEDNTIDLFTNIEFEDTICNTEIYLVEFDGDMSFYTDNNFNITQHEAYNIGIDTIYVSINLNYDSSSDSSLNIFEADLINVWLCTVHLEEGDIDFNVQQNGRDNGGCFAANIVDDNQPYHIIQNAEIGAGFDNLDVVIYHNLSHSNQVRFSFITPNTGNIRNNLYIHTQIKIELTEEQYEEDNKRRLIGDNVQDQIRHFMDYTEILQESRQQSTGTGSKTNLLSSIHKLINKINTTVILSAIIVVLLVIISIIFMTCKIRKTVNQVNEEIDTENARINPYVYRDEL